MNLQVLAAGVVAVVFLGAPRADACSAPCPVSELVAPSVPANAPGIPTRGPGVMTLLGPDGGLHPSHVTTDSHFAKVLVPDAPLAPDTDYAVTFTQNCAVDAGVQRLHTTATATIPTAALGTATVGPLAVGTFQTETSCGSCVADMQAASREISIAVPPALAPFIEVTRFELVVDGTPFRSPGGPREGFRFGPAADGGVSITAFGRCVRGGIDLDQGLTLGQHAAEIRATIAGTTTALTSTPFMFELTCAGVCLSGPDGCFGERLVTCDGGSTTDAGADAGAVADAGPVTQPDAGTGTDGGTTTEPMPQGCGCSTSPAAMALLLALFVRRRR